MGKAPHSRDRNCHNSLSVSTLSLFTFFFSPSFAISAAAETFFSLSLSLSLSLFLSIYLGRFIVTEKKLKERQFQADRQTDRQGSLGVGSYVALWTA